MIRKIQIKNFKSIVDMELSLGRFNVLIGENGGGKSNVLEAIGMAGLELAGQIKSEYFYRRGLRPGIEDLLFSKFPETTQKVIYILCSDDLNEKRAFALEYDSEFQQWINNARVQLSIDLQDDIAKIKNGEAPKNIPGSIAPEIKELLEKGRFGAALARGTNILNQTFNHFHGLEKFMVFAPENTVLRQFKDEESTPPLGFNGQGLLDHLRELLFTDGYHDALIDFLHLLDWFNNLTVGGGLFDRSIQLSDNFLGEGQIIDQRNANEGFLFLLFYYVLFTSPHTPKFFAIDNIEASFNPKLCRKVIRELYKLAVKHDKQVILTTHNPFVLDGLNLEDEEQKLIVIRRSIDGPTLTTPILKNPIGIDRTIPLSEAWMKGLLGGLPDNF